MMARAKYDEWLEEDGLIKIQGWARDGLSEKQIAKNMGISLSTFKVWRKKYQAISTAYKKGKVVVDREVENALHKSAIGYWVEETETIIEQFGGGKEKKRIKKNRKWIPANTASQIYWLKNRKPEEWRERREEDAVTNTSVVIVDSWSGVDE